MGPRLLRYTRQFFRTFERGSALLPELGGPARGAATGAEHEARTICIVLCSAKNDAMVKITLPEDNEQIVATRYQLYLPTEEDLRAELARERDEAERRLARRARR